MNRILLAEDNEANRELMLECLQAAGYEVVLATNGQEALGRIQETQPDLVLLDLHMPKLNGFAVLQQLHADRLWRRVPVLAVTAFAMADDRRKVMEAGFDGYVTKPVDLKMLRHEVQRWLRGENPKPAAV